MMMEQITSVKNTKVKTWASLKQKKFRTQTGLYIAEGVRLVEEAVQSHAQVQEILICGDIQSGKFDAIINGANSQEVQLYEVTEAVLEHVADTKTPQGVVAIIRQSEGDPEAFIANKENPLYLVLDAIQDPGNLGTIIRTADAVGATGVLLSKTSVDLYNPKVVRATMGSLFHLPVFEVDLETFLPKLKEIGVSVIGTSVTAEKTVYESNFTGAAALVIGSEAHGLTASIAEQIDTEIALPMPGKAESLNAAIAASVMMYEALRQRKF
jgi:RNA methyltransferase, TrmH family